jgi:hypothetical protein
MDGMRIPYSLKKLVDEVHHVSLYWADVWLIDKPNVQVEGIVAGGVAAQAVVVRAGPVELVIDDVLNGNLGIIPG